MADQVQRQLEAMVPELEDLEDRGLLNADEVRAVVAKRRDFEYLLQRRSPRKEDFLRYIEYEMSLEKLRVKRKKRKGIKLRGVADQAGKRRIHQIFERAIRRFRGDLELVRSAVSFSTKVKAHGVTNKRLGEAMKLYPREVGFWIAAATFHFRVQNDMPSARAVMQTGLRINKESAKLWAEYLRLEALFLYQLRRRRVVLGIDKEDGGTQAADAAIEERNELEAGAAAGVASEDDARNEVLYKGKLLQIVLKNAVVALPGSFELRREICDALEPFLGSLVGPLAHDVISSMWRDATSSDKVPHDGAAERCWEGRIRFEFRHGKADSVSSAEEAALEMFQEATDAVPTPLMFRLAANFIIARLEAEDPAEETAASAGRKRPRRRAAASEGSPEGARRAALERALEKLLDAPVALEHATLCMIAKQAAEGGNAAVLARCHEMSPGNPRIAELMLDQGVKRKQADNLLQRTLAAFLAEGGMTTAEGRADVEAFYMHYLELCIADSKLSGKDVVARFHSAIKWFHLEGKVDGFDVQGRIASLATGLLAWLATAHDAALLDSAFAQLESSNIPPVLPKEVFWKMTELREDEPPAVRAILRKATLAFPDDEDLWLASIALERKHGDLVAEKAVLIRAMQSVADREALLNRISRAEC
mmetsp:Transcript_19639/g.49635  ORF Transcript_19639/g.49635 Transcript_19639/m.49635 type:complete len:650 (+) Transcript_19639:162-2111(+)